MEQFSTLLTESYNLEKEMTKYISTLTNESKGIVVKCTPSEFKMSFEPNFGNNAKKVFNVMENITKIAGDYPYIETTDIDKKKFNIKLKK